MRQPRPERSFSILTASAAAVLLRTDPLLAEPAVRDFQYDAVEFWAGRILSVAALLSLAAIAYTLAHVLRGRARGTAGKVLTLASAVVLPSFTVSTGMVLVFARAERVEFCGSCHAAMEPFVADMVSPEGASMAAIHYANRFIPSNQCYECHTSYGLFGSAQAKLHGASQVLRYYGGAFSPPARLWQPYPNADCLKCHAASRLWLAEPAHTTDGMMESLFEDVVSCMECHEPGHLVSAPLDEGRS